MKKIIASLGVSGTAFLPLLALAQFGEINSFFGKITSFINDVLIPLVFAVALLAFIWGAFKFFIWKGNEEDAQKEGKNLMIYSVVGFVMMVSIFGIVNLIADGFGFSGEDLQDIPDAPTSNR